MAVPWQAVLDAADVAVGHIYRLSSGYVNVQEDAPWQGKYGQGWVEHCDLSVGWVYHRAGLDRDSYANEGYTVTSVGWYRGGNGRYRGDLTPRVADSGYMDWQDHDGLGGDAGATDHVELLTGPILTGDDGQPVCDDAGVPLIDVGGGYLETIGWNTTPDGRGYRYRRPLAYFVAFGHPELTGATTPIPGPAPEAPARRRVLTAPITL